MRDVAVISFAQSKAEARAEWSEAQLLVPVVAEAIAGSGLDRRSIDFTCSGSADYLSGQPFAFVSNLEATGAWPPISESHVEMDGAWALYEAWVRLQHGDVDTALVFGSGKSSPADLGEVLSLQLDPYYLMPLWLDNVSAAALQAQAVMTRLGVTERDLAAIVARSRRDAASNPYAQVSGEVAVDDLLADEYVASPLRRHDAAPSSDGAAAVVLAAGDTARQLCERPAWIRGIDHRVEPHYLGLRDLSVSESARLAGAQAGVGGGPVEVAELCTTFSHEEPILRDALGLDDAVVVNPSGGPLTGNPIMATGLIRIGEAFRQISEHGRSRVVAHAASGPCLQQNLVCVLEGEG